MTSFFSEKTISTASLFEDGVFEGERAKFAQNGGTFHRCLFQNGESPLKESRDLTLLSCLFKWKYPLWYCNDVTLQDCTLFEMARAGIWYTNRIAMTDCVVEAPKALRRCDDVALQNVQFAVASETLWHCRNVTAKQIFAKGDYFAMNCENFHAENLNLVGNYAFDGLIGGDFDRCKLVTKDAFWNSDGVTVRNSFISGEYLGWNAKNLTLIDCTIESLQGLCYIDNLRLQNCRLLNTTLAFEYSSVNAEIDGGVDSVLNPKSGCIRADRIGTLILEKDRIDPSKVTIVCRNGD